MVGRTGSRLCVYFFSLSLSITKMVMWSPHFFIYNKIYGDIIVRPKITWCIICCITQLQKVHKPFCWVRSVWDQTPSLRLSTPADLPDAPLPFQLHLLPLGSLQSNLSLLRSRNRSSIWITLHRLQPGHLISNLRLLVITGRRFTFQRSNGDAQTWDRIPGDVTKPGWFAALIHVGQTLQVLTSGHSPFIILSIQH